MTLADTSVWVEHLRTRNAAFAAMLAAKRVLIHPFVIGELACGNFSNRERILADLQLLPNSVPADHADVVHLIETHRLWGRGVGWIDCHLLASALLSGCGLWTLDAAMRRAAATLRISSA